MKWQTKYCNGTRNVANGYIPAFTNYDTTSVSVSLDDSLSVKTKSQYLHLAYFNFSLPSSAIISSLEVNYRRGFSSGSIVTEEFFLANNDFSTLSDTYSEEEGWISGSLETKTYNFPNPNLTVADVNNSLFGMKLSAKLNSGSTCSGRVDWGTSYITVSYYEVFNQKPSGGSKSGGTAPINVVYNTSFNGGTTISGHGALVIDETTSGGSISGGAADENSQIGVSGGSSLGGNADYFVQINGNLSINDFEMILSGRKNVPPDLTHNQRAIARITVDPSNNIVRWKITHTLSSCEAAKILGPATKTQTSGLGINISNLGPLTSPIIGSTGVTTTRANQIRNGQFYLFLQNNIPRQYLRSQIWNLHINIGGEASFGLTFNFEIPSAGVVIGGSFTDKKTTTEFFQNGASLGGNVSTVFFGNIESAGSSLSGEADVSHVKNQPLPIGGAKLEISSSLNVNYLAKINLDAAGIRNNGNSIIGINPAISGGIVLSSNTPFVRETYLSFVGGSIISGSHDLQHTYADQDITGLARLGGRARVEYLKVLVSNRSSFSRASASQNILTNPPPDPNKIINPISLTIPELDPNRYTINHNPGYCTFDQNCTSGAAKIPPIIVKRQGKYMPAQNVS